MLNYALYQLKEFQQKMVCPGHPKTESQHFDYKHKKKQLKQLHTETALFYCNMRLYICTGEIDNKACT